MELAAISLGLLGLVRPHWTRVRLACRAGIDGALTLALVSLFFTHRSTFQELLGQAHTLAVARAPQATVALSLDLGLAWFLVMAAVISGVSCLVRLILLVTWRKPLPSV